MTNFRGTAGDDVFSGNSAKDKFKLAQGGNDTALGGGGNDTFSMGAALNAADVIDGGGGQKDKVVLNGDYSAGVVFGATTMLNVEVMRITGAHDCGLTTHDATVAAGALLTVEAGAIGGGHALFFDGSAETDGHFALNGSTSADELIGGAGNDSFKGGTGADEITGGLGADTFVYNAPGESSSTGHDVIHGLNANTDLFDLDVAVTGFDGVIGLSVTTIGFDVDIALATLGEMGANHAIIVEGRPGSAFNGRDFLVVDRDGNGLYAAGADYVIEITGYTGTFSTADFI
jgi:Ca2+-binding RTX toxin-like protein